MIVGHMLMMNREMPAANSTENSKAPWAMSDAERGDDDGLRQLAPGDGGRQTEETPAHR